MEPSTELHAQAPRPPPASTRHGFGRAAGRAVLWLHGLADRFDLIPGEFGDGAEVDAADPRALVREWRRQAARWAAYNPEEVFALKAGAAALGLALVILVALVRAVG